MSRIAFETTVLALGLGFALAFFFIVIPPLLGTGDVIGAFAAGFVNPYSSGYALDAILCAAILWVWIFYERRSLGVKHGWIAIPLSFLPGVATAFAIYLAMRSWQLHAREMPQK